MTDAADSRTTTLQSRRAALQLGGGLLAAIGALSLSGSVRAQATPTADGAGEKLILVQGFSKGSLFPTQGDADSPPYTVILWDAADRGLVLVTSTGVSFAPTDSLIIAIEAGERPQAALVVPGQDDGAPPQVWALQLAYGGLGSDPGAVTYQGEPLDEASAASWLGVTPSPLPDGAQDLSAGYLVVGGLPALDVPENERVHLPLS